MAEAISKTHLLSSRKHTQIKKGKLPSSVLLSVVSKGNANDCERFSKRFNEKFSFKKSWRRLEQHHIQMNPRDIDRTLYPITCA